MKVLVINHSPLVGSGSGTYTLNIVKQLKKEGIDVRLITAANTLDFPKIEGVKIYPIYFKYQDEIPNQINFGVPCFDQYPTSDVVFYNMTEEQMNIYENKFKETLEQAIKEFSPDLIHTQHIWIWSSIVTKYNIPTIITSHGSDMMGYDIDNNFYKYCIKAINGCKKIITISKINYETVTNRFPESKNKAVIIKNGYDSNIFGVQKLDREKTLKEFGINRNYKNIVLFAGRLTENKGIDILLNSAKKYENEETATIIAGGGGLLLTLKQQVKDLNLRNVFFVGNQLQENLAKLYNISDVLVAPSRVEGFGLVGIEALACGIPVIGTNNGGMTEFIKDEVGELINSEDVNMLEKAIKKILKNKEKYTQDRLSEYAYNNYSQESVIKNLIKEYQKILKY